MALDWENIIVDDDENSQVQDTPVTIMASATSEQRIAWDKLIIVEEETTVEGEDESVMIFASGIPGHSATIDEVTAETLPEGSEATVDNVGSSANARLRFGIPRGNTGEKGDTGDKGDKGDKGDPGIAGAEYDAENERVIFYPTDDDVYTKTETDEALLSKAPVILSSASGPIASFSDGSASPVTDLNVTIEPVQDLHGYDNPWPAGGGKNIFDASITPINAYINKGNIIGQNDSRSVILPIKPSTTYTMSGSHVLLGSSKDDFNVAVFSTQPTIGSTGGRMIFAAATNPMSVTFTTTAEENWIAIKVANITKANYEETVATIQIELGSSATSYAPYSNICPISGHTSAKIVHGQENIVSADALTWAYGYLDDNGIFVPSPSQITGYSSDIKIKPNTTYTLNFSPSGNAFRVYFREINGRWISRTSILYPANNLPYTFTTPSNCGIIQLQANNVAFEDSSFAVCLREGTDGTMLPEANVITIDLDGTRYGGTLNVLTGEMTVVKWERDFTGSENWQVAYNRMYVEFTAYIPPNDNNKKLFACSHYKTASANGTYDNRGTEGYIGCAVGYTNSKGRVYIIDNVNNPTKNVDTLKSYLAEQYANNTPLTVVYELGTPLTVQLSPSQLSTLLGQNNIWADTGDIAVEYRADTKLYIQKLTKPTEDDMIANTNIAANTFFMVGNNLYFATSAIATGTTIVPGSNCTALSLADALNNLNA